MAAYTDRQTTEDFADLLYELSDLAERDLQIDDANECGFMEPAGQALVVEDFEGDKTYHITIRKVT